ncbi:GAF domain-containing protein [Bacteroidota bacterium]
MKGIRSSITYKVGAYILLTIFVALFISGGIIAYKFSKIQDRGVERQILVPALLINKEILNIDVINNIRSVSLLLLARPDECLIVGINNKVYYSIKSDQLGLNINEVKDLAYFKPKLIGLTERSSYYQSENNSKYLFNISPIYLNASNLSGYLIIKMNAHKVQSRKIRFVLFFGFISGLCLIVTAFLIYFIMNNRVTGRMKQMLKLLKELEEGKTNINADKQIFDDEIGDLEKEMVELASNLEEKAKFASEIEKGNFSYEFKIKNKNDKLANALIDMRDSLKKATDENKKRQIEDEKRNWTTEGIAKFSDILRQHIDDINELSYLIISNLVKYIKASQANLFLVNNEVENKPILELVAAYAYERKKHKQKEIEFGEGLVGAVAIERKTMHITEIPDSYVEITSGLGKANPNAILIVPLMREEELYGILEIATFNLFEDHEINFIEKIGESIATTLYNTRINLTTSKLLQQSQEQAEQMRTQEEEMRQNMEELSATQEEMGRQQEDMKQKIEELENELGEKEEELKKYKGDSE